jgi:hypothetical protein
MRMALWFGAASALMIACSDSGDPGEPHDAVADDLTASTNGAEDSYVTSYNNAPRGAYANLRVGASASLQQQTYLKFQVKSIPAGALNVRATLKLHASTTSSDAIEAHLASSNSWSESTIALSNAPGAHAAVLAKVAGTTAGAWSSFDVSSAVAGNGTFSFVLSVPSGSIVDFASKEAGAATAPALTVTYDAAPPPPPAANTLFGAAFNPHNDARHGALVSQWGGMQVVRSYDGGSGVAPFLNTFQAEDLRYGAASSYSFKYAPSEVLAGQHDAAIRGFFQGIANNHPVYWTYWHEPDDELYKTHSFTPADYRSAWAHIKQIANQVKATQPNLKVFATLIIMQYSMTPNVAPSRPLLGANGMYPGDDVIDVFGVDAYNADAAKGGITDAATQFGKVIDFAQQHGKPWAIGELGSCPVVGNPQGRATYLSNAFKYWKSRQPPVFAAYFNVDWPTCDYRFDGDTAATKVWHDATTLGLAAF